MLTINTKAPDFSLLDQNNTVHTLIQYLGKWVVIYFYPKDNTPGCSKEACGFRDAYSDFLKNDIVVLGVSKDSVKSHDNFVSKYKLPFTLLSDDSATTIKAYQAWGEKKFMGRTFEGILRITYLINPKGKITKVYPKVSPASHAQDILKDYQTQE